MSPFGWGEGEGGGSRDNRTSDSRVPPIDGASRRNCNALKGRYSILFHVRSKTFGSRVIPERAVYYPSYEYSSSTSVYALLLFFFLGGGRGLGTDAIQFRGRSEGRILGGMLYVFFNYTIWTLNVVSIEFLISSNRFVRFFFF